MSEKRPNILLILTDQHRLSAVGAYGVTPCQTPNIDRLALEGVRFENTYTACPVCTPTRASIITGQMPHNHGMIQNTEDAWAAVHELPDNRQLLSRRLEAAGYQLGYTGKWHLGSTYTQKLGSLITPCLPKDVGFIGQNFPGHGDGGWYYQEFKEYLKQRGLKHGIKPWSESTIPYRYDENGAILEQAVEGSVPYFLAENTISLIDKFRANEEPFFVWHNFWGPHSPYYVTNDYLEMYRNVEIPEWPNYRWPAKEIEGPHQFSITPQLLWREQNLTWPDWAMAIRYYYAFASMIDAQIGRIIDHLNRTGLLENTVIVFAADHGESLGDHGGIYNKGWTHFEETHRIPLIIRMPGKVSAGRVVQELASAVDLYPTLLDFAGITCPAPVPRPGRPANWPYEVAHHPDGMSLVPLVRGENVQWRDTVVSEFHGLYDNSCIMRTMRHGQYKYGFNFMGTDELYDLEKDPYELNNVINDPDYSDVVEHLQQCLWDWMSQTQDNAVGGFYFLRLKGRKM